MIKTKTKYKAIIRYSELYNRKTFNLYSEDKDELINIVSKLISNAYGVYDPALIKKSSTNIGIVSSEGIYEER